MSEKLKPCPFCGSDAIMWSWNGGVVVECSKYNQRCHHASVEGKTEAEAIEKLNHRVERTAKVIEHNNFVHPLAEHNINYEYYWELLCGFCKNKVQEGDDYCSHCGARLEWSSENVS